MGDKEIVASYMFHPDIEGWESLTCYLELEPSETGWRARSVGLWFITCVGFWWVEGLTGSVVVDGSNPARLTFRVALQGTFYSSHHSFCGDFYVVPSEDSDELRRDLRYFGWQPTPDRER